MEKIQEWNELLEIMFFVIDKNVRAILIYGPYFVYFICEENMDNIDRYLKVKDIQKIIGCSEKKAYAIIKKKSFPKIKIGKQYYIPIAAFHEWERTYMFKEFKIE